MAEVVSPDEGTTRTAVETVQDRTPTASEKQGQLVPSHVNLEELGVFLGELGFLLGLPLKTNERV